MAKSKFTFVVASEMVVVGTNPEFADFDNPRGEIIRERFFMVAEDSEGRQYRFGNAETEAGAEREFRYLAPAVSEWPYFRCVYGSTAYIEDKCELDQMRSDMEYDLGPDWMHHSQVSFEARNQLF
jgi:hypothetical protein